MIAIIIAVASVVAYLQIANDNGTAKMHLLHPQVQPWDHSLNKPQSQPVHRFGYDFGARRDD